MDSKELKEICSEVRRIVVNEIADAKSGHPGGSLSAVEMMVALYFSKMKIDPKNPKDPDRDRFVLSKGHAAPALYGVLALRGFYPVEEIKTFRKFGSRLQGHPNSRLTPGVEVCTGSLGQGMSMAVGMALGAKHAGKDINVYTITGDGELQEGLIWEAAMAAANYKLDNFTMMIDNNGLQIDGKNDDVMSLGDLHAKMTAFGFHVLEVADGNDIDQVLKALDEPTEPGKPRCIIFHTVKGKGVSYMEGDPNWHGKSPNEEQRQQALKDLEG